MNNLFQGVFPVMNTPFLDNGDVDYAGIANIVEHVIEEGCTRLSIFALNSEPNKLTDDEKIRVLEAFFAAARGRAETAVGVLHSSIRGAGEMCRIAQDMGADGVILFPPIIVPPTGAKLMGYLQQVAAHVDIPVMYQDAPRTTGVTVTNEFLLEAHRLIPNLRYIKVESVHPVLRLAELIESSDGELRCLTGNGGIYTVDGFVRGAWGVMPGVANVAHFCALHDSFAAGDLARARDIFENMMPLLWFEDQSLEFFVACEKEILKRKGVIASAHVRDPGLMLDDANRDELWALLDRLRPLS